MANAFNDAALLQACYDIARTTSWEHRNPQSTSLDAITGKANRYRALALDQVEYLESNGCDPNVLIGAVRYLGIHAVPPMADDEKWFIDMLEVIVQLFSPNVVLTRGDDLVAFLRTLRDAIDQNITDAEARQPSAND